MSLSRDMPLNMGNGKGGSSIMFGNVAGLYPRTNTVKVQLLGETAKENGVVIVALTESHLKSQILDAEVHIPGFLLFRADRQDYISKGGVIIYVKEEYAYGTKVLTSNCNGTAEWICLFLPIINTIMINIYRPPTCSEQKFKEMLADLSATLDKISPPMPTVVMCGDFNFPIINWETGNTVGGTLEMQRQAAALLEFMRVHCLQQMISEPTRQQNILDLFLTNAPEIVGNIEVLNTVISDHKLITVDTCIEDIQPQKCKKEKLEGFAALNFHHKKIEWKKLNEELALIDWERELNAKCVDKMLSLIYEKLFCVCSNFIPKKGELIRKSIIPRDRRILMRNRANISRKLNHVHPSKKSALGKKLEILEFKLLESHKREEKAREIKAVNTIRENSKYFFAYAKEKSNIRVPIGPLEEEGRLIKDEQEISQVLQNQFKSVFSQPKFPQTDPKNFEQEEKHFFNIEISVADIDEAIQKLSSDSAPGPDCVPPVLIKECMHSLKHPLCILWRESMRSGKIPDRLKLGLIIPVHKNGPRSQARNYRPITLTSHIIKIFERVLTKKLIEYLDANLLLNDRQHGFRKGRSCLSQLIDHYQDLLNIMEDRSSADVIYLDFAKAFDKVDHGILIRKLVEIGVNGNVLVWIFEFLTNRQQIVKVSGSRSSGACVVSGVPQGTVLGPILFLIFVGDIDSRLRNAQASSFADDTRVVLQICSETDTYNLQNDLNVLYEWSRTNNMMFNGSKFEHLRYGHHQINRNYLTPEGEPINMITDTRDLGITMSSSGNFDKHINNISLKGSQMAGWTLRTFKTRDPFPMMMLFKAMVFPIVEYCCQIWSPKKLYQIRSLESVQRHFTANLAGTAGMSYRQRLKFLKLYSLERRRDRYAIIYVWKIMQGMVPNLTSSDRIKCSDSLRLGRFCQIPSLNHSAPRYVQTLRENSFCVHGPRLFNVLEKNLRDFNGSLDTFNKNLDKYLDTVEDVPIDPTEPQVVASNSLLDQAAQACSRLRSRPQ